MRDVLGWRAAGKRRAGGGSTLRVAVRPRSSIGLTRLQSGSGALV